MKQIQLELKSVQFAGNLFFKGAGLPGSGRPGIPLPPNCFLSSRRKDFLGKLDPKCPPPPVGLVAGVFGIFSRKDHPLETAPGFEPHSTWTLTQDPQKKSKALFLTFWPGGRWSKESIASRCRPVFAKECHPCNVGFQLNVPALQILITGAV